MELEVDILQCLKQIEEESKGRNASKVSKIATMFQFPSESDDRDEKDGTGPQVTVVRTESHVARFNTARALFEKMAEKKSDDSKSSKVAQAHHHHHQQQHHHHQHHPRRQCGGQHVIHSTARCTSSSGCGKASSRSPSPASSHSIHHQPNGHNSSSYKPSNPTSISTITSSYTPPPPPAFHSSIQNPSIPSVLPLSVRSTLEAEVFKGNRHPVVTGEIPKSNVDLRNKSESSKCQHKEETHLSNRDCIGAGNRSYVNNGVLNKFDDGNNDVHNKKYDHSLERKEAKSRPNSLLKPEKPAKPETLIDKPLSSHLQNQQIIQRHKNWFQSYSKTKSPVTSPLKPHPPTSNSFEQRTHDEENSPSVHGDWRRERSAILKGSGRSSDQDEVKSSSDVNAKSFENVATLPSCWSPPKQYNEASVTTGDKERHIKDSGYSSSAVLSGGSEDFRREPLSSVDNSEVECKTYIITDISKDARKREWKPTYSDVHDNKQIAGVFKKGSEVVGSSDGLQSSTSSQNRSRVSEEESNVVLRHRDDLPVDKELRLKEWEKRLSQRDSFLEGKSSERNVSESSSSSSMGRMERNQLRDSQNDRKDRKRMEEEHESRRTSDVEINKSDAIRKTEEAFQQRLHHEDDREARQRKLQTEKERINKDTERRLRKEEIQRNQDEYREIERKDEREIPERVKLEREVLRGKERMANEEREKLRREDENLKLEKEGRHSLRRERERKRLEKEKEEIEREKLKREEQAKERIREAEEQERRNREEERRERLRWEKEERERLKLEAEEKERLRKESEKRERLKRDEENREKLRREEERERLKKEEEEREKIKKEKERIKREEEERERFIKEEVRLRKEEEVKERLRKEKEERERLRKEEEEREKIRGEEEEREIMRRAEEERERLRKEEAERDRLKREKEERDRIKREEEERERIRRVKEEKERIRREEKEREMIRRVKEEKERIKREEEERERIKREEEEKERIKREEQKERMRREEEERERQRREIEERERLRREEEMERIRIEKEEMERLRREKEERERLRREEEKRERLRIEEEERRKEETRELLRREEEAKEKQRLKMEEEERERIRKDNEERERLRKEALEQERLRKEAEVMERLKKEQDEKEKLKREEEERERLREAQEKDINYQKEELERKWQAKRDKLDEEEKIRKEKDRLEIEKTKKRIAELKKERDEIQRQQAHRLRMLMTENSTDEGDNAVDTWQVIPPEEEEVEVEVSYPKRSIPAPHIEKDSTVSIEINVIPDSQTPTVIVTHIDDDIEQETEDDTDPSEETILDQKTSSEIDLHKETTDYADLDQETNARRVAEAFSSHNESNISDDRPIDGFEENFEDIAYDHTVLSAQHKLQFCTSSYNDSITKEPEEKREVPHLDYFSSSTLSSEFEPLPPPVPPHNVDPATLTSSVCIDQQRLPSLPAEAELPEPMTPEEAEKLLSHNIIETKRGLLADAGEQELSKSSNVQQSLKEESDREEIDIPTTIKLEQDDAFDKDYDSVCVDSPTPDNEEDEEEPYTYFKHQMNEEGFVIRAKEVLNEDGIHYLEDGHFWIQVPGLTEDDEDELPETVSVHKHTKLKFSKDPIKLFSTFSVTDYDRRNDDVDPVAASAEYELEKRVEKMNVFPVCIEKGEGGLGLSIIGMGVGADAGVEKLGIFVKTITPGGATAGDGRIQVNDQIIEVDNQSLVGVTQMFAASVLKNTSGTVNFLIGRENDPENSEVAMLIRQSLMADQERDERRRALEGPNYDPRNSTGIFESFSSQSGGESPSEEASRNNYAPSHQELYGQEYADQYGDVYGSCTSSPPEGISSPPPEAYNHEVEGRELLLQNNEIIIMSQHLQEIQHRNDMYEEEINILRNKICDLEKERGSTADMSRRIQETTVKLKELEDTLQSRQSEISTYQDMLEQSQGQYIILEKKYYKAKKIIKEYQSRERDFLHREEYHITQLEEKDALYNSLVKALKDRVIQLEGDLIKAQQEAGLPVKIPPDLNSQSSNFVQSKGQDNQSLQRDPPRKPASINTLDADLSDNEAGDTHTSEGSKSSTVERKIPSKEELDVAVPPTELLDNSFSKAKGELASRGGLANRQLPSLKKSSSNASANSFDHCFDDIVDDSLPESQQQQHQLTPSSTVQSRSTSSSTFHSEESSIHSSSSTPTTSTAPNTHSQGNMVYGSRTQPPPPYQATHTQTPTHPTSPQHQPPPYQPPPSAPLSYRPGISSDAQSGRHPPPVARVQPVNRVEAVNSPLSFNNQQHQQTLAHQLKALLAEREGNPEAMQEGGNSCMKKSPSSLMEDVRRANIQADMSIGKKPVISGPIHVSSTAQVVSTGQFVHSRTSPQKSSSVGSFQQKINRDSGSWSPVINASNSPGSVVLLSQRPIDSSLPMTPTSETGDMSTKHSMVSLDSTSSFDSQTPERFPSGRPPKEITPVIDWTKEQVAQWLVVQGLENYVSTFVNAGITGPRLINIDTRDLKNLGLSTDDKTKIKRKVKELRQNVEKEKKQREKENKEREKLQRKAEKLAEKAERRKK